MGAITPIAWCDATFNPWVGCLRVSTACEMLGFVGLAAGGKWIRTIGSARRRRPWREIPRPTIVVSRDDLCLMTYPAYRSGISFRQQPRDLSQERDRWF